MTAEIEMDCGNPPMARTAPGRIVTYVESHVIGCEKETRVTSSGSEASLSNAARLLPHLWLLFDLTRTPISLRDDLVVDNQKTPETAPILPAGGRTVIAWCRSDRAWWSGRRPSGRRASQRNLLSKVPTGTFDRTRAASAARDRVRQHDLAVESDELTRPHGSTRCRSTPMDKDVFMVTHASPDVVTGAEPRSRPPSSRRSKTACLALIAACAFVAAACNGDTNGTVTSSSPVSQGSLSATTSPPSSVEPSTTSPLSPDEAAAVSAWRVLWDAATRRPGTEEGARGVADPAVVDRLFALTREPRMVTSSPTPSSGPDGAVRIVDCVFVSPTLSATATIGFEGLVMKGSDGKSKVTDLMPRSGQLLPCAPSAMSAAATAGYEAYWDARLRFWDPPNEGSPLVAETMTGPQRALIQQLLREHQTRNLAFRGRPTTHPEVIEVRSPTELVILDCQLADPGTGIFDRGSGVRAPDVDPIAPGQRDLTSAVMRLEGGSWKVSDVQGQVGVTCDFSPTTRALPIY
jgi:hypothetical protein